LEKEYKKAMDSSSMTLFLLIADCRLLIAVPLTYGSGNEYAAESTTIRSRKDNGMDGIQMDGNLQIEIILISIHLS
jgi:hypothetical protein